MLLFCGSMMYTNVFVNALLPQALKLSQFFLDSFSIKTLFLKLVVPYIYKPLVFLKEIQYFILTYYLTIIYKNIS